MAVKFDFEKGWQAMKRQTIYKGFHRPLFGFPAFRHFKIFDCENDSYRITRKIRFQESCRYAIAGVDQLDWNKLFGVSIGLTGIHQNSFRFVWRYDRWDGVINIGIYEYHNGDVEYKYVKSVNIGDTIEFRMYLNAHDGQMMCG